MEARQRSRLALDQAEDARGGGVRVPSTTSIRPGKSLLMIPARVVLAMQDDG